MPNFITNPETPGPTEHAAGRNLSGKFLRSLLRLCACGLILVFPLFAQSKIAVLVPEKKAAGEKFAEKLEESLSLKLKVLDSSLSETAFRSFEIERPFNLTINEGKLIGAAIGCDFFLLVRAENQRRFSFVKKEYFESHAVLYLVSSRTGRLIFWKLASFEDAEAETAEKKLLDATKDLATEISARASLAAKEELNEKAPPELEEIPEESRPEAKNFRPPLPFRRLSPAYTEMAGFYKVEATVDIEADFDENGRILRTEIVRWAGFGLDESVAETVRRMNWRPAERNGKTLPIRVLLRYNFRKLDKEEEF